jgi:branched-chain amino acid transport system permease protein
MIKKATLLKFLPYTVSLIVLCVLPIFIGKSNTNLGIEILILALAGLALNFIFGNADMINFGHAGPYAIGAYATTILSIKVGVPFWLAFLAGPLVAGLIYFIVGLIFVRFIEIYFAFLTFAFCLLVWTTTYTWYSVTGGDDGLSPVRVPEFLLSVENYYYFTLLVVTICTIVLKVITDSPFGRILRSIRENTTRTEFIGIDVEKYKLIAFVMSGFFAGVAGSLYAGFSHGAYPSYAYLLKTTVFMLVCIMGGMYTFSGPIVGAFVYLLLYKIVSTHTEHWELVFGSILVLLCLFLRGGIVGFIEERWKSWFKESAL